MNQLCHILSYVKDIFWKTGIKRKQQNPSKIHHWEAVGDLHSEGILILAQYNTVRQDSDLWYSKAQSDPVTAGHKPEHPLLALFFSLLLTTVTF